jgi:hypothetical protein
MFMVFGRAIIVRNQHPKSKADAAGRVMLFSGYVKNPSGDTKVIAINVTGLASAAVTRPLIHATRKGSNARLLSDWQPTAIISQRPPPE